MARIGGFFIWILTGLVLLVAALALFLVLFDWNLLKPTINERVSEALDRPFAIEGDLSVAWRREPETDGGRAWLPWPHIAAEQMILGNPEWAEGDTFVSLQQVKLRLALLPLLSKTVHIPRIDVQGPVVNAQRLADGRDNWTFDLGSEDDASAEESAPWKLDIGTIGFDQGQIMVDDAISKLQLDMQVEPLGEPIAFDEIVGKPEESATAAPQEYVFAWRAEGRYQGQTVQGEGKVGGLLALQDAALPFPLEADVRAGSTRIRLAGTLTDPQNLGALDLNLRLSGTSLGNLYPLTGVTLPDSPPYSTDGRLSAQLQAAEGATYRYQDFNGSIGDSDIHGDLTYVAGEPRPKLSGSLVSNQLLFSDLAPLIGADSNAEKEARGSSARQPADKVLPVEEFRTERWRAMDADVHVRGRHIVHSEQLPITDLDAQVLLEDGRLHLAPLKFGMAGGELQADIRLNGGTTPLQGQAKLNARGFKLKELAPSFAPMQTSLGELNGDADLSGHGNSVAALLGSADGSVQLVINDGTVSRSLMEIAGLNVGNYLITKMFGDEDVQINCAVADLALDDGLMTTPIFIIDTENALIRVDGEVNFASEELDLDISPDSKGMRIFSLRSPLYVRGSFSDPNPGVHAGPLALRGTGMLALGAVTPAAALLALIAPSGEQTSQCQELLEEMRNDQR
ncbi:hypothetical protein SAMN05216198_1704 [Halopseudomonas litoralis]|uniref:AsmA domain-containing protein n=1 Tax=Halopseudomonas litoralis TaxID=797277 RepID=A0A1H1RB64_9GAMM|nr:AsmA family protein [Halopseudomonas litoralis]SDS32933.1 hypothetical protein SAMN05216198_1704 [Halopseudomonas litoralis]